MIKCPNCGVENEPGSRFCAECGTDLRSLTPSAPAAPLPPPEAPAPPTAPSPPWSYSPPPTGSADLPPSDPNWRMASVGGEVPPPKTGRPRWLIITLGIIVAFLLCCCIFFVWAATAGEDTVERWGTEISERATRESD